MMKVRNYLVFALLFATSLLYAESRVEKWKVFEIKLDGPSAGNPFVDTKLSATFSNDKTTMTVDGFYDGDGIYRIRFMPFMEGEWSYLTSSNVKKLTGKKGRFICYAPEEGNHGPVMVKDTFYFAYADGVPHYSFGTSVYNWVHQNDTLSDLTLDYLKKGYFNKLRFSIFHLNFRWGRNEPLLYPYQKDPTGLWDFKKFNPLYFQNIDKRIIQLDSLGIEADLIAFTYLDRQGFKNMGRENDEHYIRYIIARYAAYKNVWWSMANEFDLLKEKSMEDWDHIIDLFARHDPYSRLRSIHNGIIMYDHTNPLISHVSIQSDSPEQARSIREKYGKPVIYDECQYEGNTDEAWGNISGEEMANRFWLAVVNGGYAGHSEMILHIKPVVSHDDPREIVWALRGGKLHGTSPGRIKFLRDIMEMAPGPLTLKTGLFGRWLQNYSAIGYNEEYYLTYFDWTQPLFMVLNLPENKKYKAEVIDTWNMTIQPVEGIFTGRSLINLPGRSLIALRLIQISE